MSRPHSELEVLAHRYLYYVLARPVLSDYDYDRLEARAKRELPGDSPVHTVGSDCASDYPADVVAYARGLSQR